MPTSSLDGANNPPSPSWADRILAHQRAFLASLGTNPARITPNADKGGNTRGSFLSAPTYKHSLVSPPTSFARFAVRQELTKMATTTAIRDGINKNKKLRQYCARYLRVHRAPVMGGHVQCGCKVAKAVAGRVLLQHALKDACNYTHLILLPYAFSFIVHSFPLGLDGLDDMVRL